MVKIQFIHNYYDIISLENLLEAWKEFVKGKRKRKDVQEFELNLMANIIWLHNDLAKFKYKHGDYEFFKISDPKPRNIHKASVRDRLLHRAIYRKLYPFFDRTFVADSFSCRLGKGTHRALNRFRYFVYKVSKNNTKSCWVLKCDIKKFFASINHEILLKILAEYIQDKNIFWLLNKIISSFYSFSPGIGLPLGNLTSQLFANIYLNNFDQFARHKLKTKFYIRYCDDFIIFSKSKEMFKDLLFKISQFLNNNLKLNLHYDKIFIKTLVSGVDFLGWVHFVDHRVLRTSTKKRMIKRIGENPTRETINSYLGLLKHGNTHNLLFLLPRGLKHHHYCS